MQGQALFTYGTLESRDRMGEVAGGAFDAQPATLAGFARYRVTAAHYPAITPETGARTGGTLYTGLDDAALVRLDRYEGPEFERRRVRVVTAAGEREAWAYVIRPEHAGRLSTQPWDAAGFPAER